MTREEFEQYAIKNNLVVWSKEQSESAIKALEELPKRRKEAKRWKAKAAQIASKQNGWIPVSERLPVEGGEYLITWTGVMDGFEKRSKPIISVTEYEIYEPDNYADWITNVSYDFEHYHDIKVTAWMPLPKPYSVDEPVDE